MARQPILPSSIADPTGQDHRERRAMADFKRRLTNIQRGLLSILDQQQYTVVTINAASLDINERVYRFELDEFIIRNIDAQIGDLIDSILLEGGPTQLWFLESYIKQAYQQGTAQSHANLAVQSAEYAVTKPNLESILLSEPYRKRLGLIRARQFESMKGFAGALKDTLSRTLTEGMALGHNPRKVALAIQKRTGVSLSRANTIARTEITTALRKARMDETEDANERLGIQTLEMHLSAFSPTTRIKHARRHGTLHTIQDQREWWSVDGNSVNCKCSTISVLVDDDGQPLTPAIVDRARQLKQKKLK